MRSRPWEKTEVAERFRALRRKAYLSQARLARIIGICRQTVSEIENCHVWPHHSTLGKFHSYEEKCNQPPIDLPAHWS